MVLDEELEERIWTILQRLSSRWRNISEDAIRSANRKQAIVPEGATVLEPVGTAPGLVVPPARAGAPTVLVLPGPPRELQPMWAAALETEAMRSALSGAVDLRQRMMRLFGIPESEIARSLEEIEAGGVDLSQLEITTCLRRSEIEIATVYEPHAEPVYEAFAAGLRERHGDVLFSPEGETVDEILAGLLTGAGATVAVAESCTGGLLAGRLTERPGSSGYMLGGVTAYSNEAKVHLAGVDADLIERHGAVSEPVARALADGARRAFGADYGIGVTGVAGPGGGTEEKPVGTVCFSVAGPDGRVDRTLRFPGDRVTVRDRSTTVALHLLRRLLLGSADRA
jgi:nicotinamide-nucleotide amidase